MLESNPLRSSCEKQIDELHLPYRFRTRDLRDAIAALRSKPILLKPLETLGLSIGPCGMRVETRHADLIFYEENTSLHHQRHIVTHELMHVYKDHPGSLSLNSTAARFIGLSPTLALRMSGRTSYSTSDEREAEMLATVVRNRMYREREVPARHPAKGAESWEALFARPSGSV